MSLTYCDCQVGTCEGKEAERCAYRHSNLRKPQGLSILDHEDFEIEIDRSLGQLTTESHPSIKSAIEFINTIEGDEREIIQLGLDDDAVSGKRGAQVCGETLRRLTEGKSVSDKFILGLAWHLRGMWFRKKTDGMIK